MSTARRPVFWLARKGDELYFVNDSEDTLSMVAAFSESNIRQLLGLDDESVDPDCYQDWKIIYHDVKPQEAVRIDSFGIGDSDYLIRSVVRVHSEKYGQIVVWAPLGKSGIGETVLLWDTGEEGKYVSIRKCERN